MGEETPPTITKINNYEKFIMNINILPVKGETGPVPPPLVTVTMVGGKH